MVSSLSERDIRRLQAELEKLPPKTQETARRLWDSPKSTDFIVQLGLVEIASRFVQESAALEEMEKTPRPPAWGGVRRGLEALAQSARDLADKLAGLPSEALGLIQRAADNAALRPTFTFSDFRPADAAWAWREAEGYTWFPVMRAEWEGSDDYAYPVPVEPEWGRDNMRGYHLQMLALFAEAVAQEAGRLQEENNGHQTTQQLPDPQFQLMGRICRRVKGIGAPKGHALQIGRSIIQWHEGKPIGAQVGERPWKRAKQIVWAPPPV